MMGHVLGQELDVVTSKKDVVPALGVLTAS